MFLTILTQRRSEGMEGTTMVQHFCIILKSNLYSSRLEFLKLLSIISEATNNKITQKYNEINKKEIKMIY